MILPQGAVGRKQKPGGKVKKGNVAKERKDGTWDDFPEFPENCASGLRGDCV